MSIKVEVAELWNKVEKLEKRLKKDEKMGVIDGKEERPKREPSKYNRFIAEHVNEMKGKTSQERFAQCVDLWHKEQGKLKKPKRPKEKSRKRRIRKKRWKRKRTNIKRQSFSFRDRKFTP